MRTAFQNLTRLKNLYQASIWYAQMFGCGTEMCQATTDFNNILDASLKTQL